MNIINYEGTKLYVNSLIPPHGFLALTFFCMILYRKEYMKYLENERFRYYILKMINHENIHKEQIKDFTRFLKWCPPLQILIGGIIFYIIYFFEWVARLFINGPANAYKNISFEKEAFEHEMDFKYIQEKRKCFNQWRKNK